MHEDLIESQKTYKRYSKYYDFIFGRLLQPGRCTAINLINKNIASNAKILDVGVGTGLSIPLYREDLALTGIDLSQEMLDFAHKKSLVLNRKVNLLVMDAEHLSFANDSFDAIVALYIASVIPNIKDFLNEICRVCRPQGDIFILNHFASDNHIINLIEKKLAKFHRSLGFHTDLSLKNLLEHPQLEFCKKYDVNAFGYWKLLHFKRR